MPNHAKPGTAPNQSETMALYGSTASCVSGSNFNAAPPTAAGPLNHAVIRLISDALLAGGSDASEPARSSSVLYARAGAIGRCQPSALAASIAGARSRDG